MEKPGTANPIYVGSIPTAASNLIKLCRGGGMVYTSDLKSLEIFLMWVRLPPAALIIVKFQLGVCLSVIIKSLF